MRVLCWNLYHGRADPPAGRALLGEFSAAIAGWAWDVALLQEVPPWWPPELAAACGAQERTALTSRNALLPLRRFLAERWPDVIKSNGGGANAILARGQGIAEHRVARLRFWPERRVVHGVRLQDGVWVANLHSQVHSEARAQADAATAARHALGWAGGAPVILGGDFNTRAPIVPGFADIDGHRVDRILGRGWRAVAPARRLDHRPFSDHAPVLLELVREGSAGDERQDSTEPQGGS